MALQTGGLSLFFFRHSFRFKYYSLQFKRLKRPYTQPTSRERKAMEKEIGGFSPAPRISVVMVESGNTAGPARRSVGSVLSQVYRNWDLHIIRQETPDLSPASKFNRPDREDPRITVTRKPANQNPVDLLNFGLDRARGDYVLFLEPGGVLDPRAFYEIVQALQEHPDTDVVYSDDFLVGRSGLPGVVRYRPDFSIDYLLSSPYTGPFTLYRTALVKELGGFRPEFSDCSGYDLLLRISEVSGNILHIPRLLYRSRESIRRDRDQEGGGKECAVRAVSDYIARKGIEGTVEPGSFGYVRLKRRIEGNPLVTVIIPTRDKIEYLERCIRSIRNSTYRNYEILIVDNESAEQESKDYFSRIMKESPDTRVIPYPFPFNYSQMNNYAVDSARGSHLIFLNNDTEVITPDWIEAMLEQSQREEVAFVGAKLLFPDDTIQHAGVVVGLSGCADHPFKCQRADTSGYMGNFVVIRNYSAVTAACMMVKTRIFRELGGFDENMKVGFGDTDLCLRAGVRGYLNVFTPYAVLYHHESKTRGKAAGADPHPADTRFFYARWEEFICEGDPYYNPNLPKYLFVTVT